MTTPKSHSRLGAPKVSTGCKTCKRRKVKCDETKPRCTRCKKAGRECLGYEPWQLIPLHDQYRSGSSTPGATPDASPGRLVLQIHANEDEHRFFQFFSRRVSKQIAGVLSDDFWTDLIPQMSFSDSAVRYGVIAIASLFRQQSQKHLLGEWSEPSSPSDLDDGFALGYYSRSLKATMTGMVESKDIQTALVTCILFFCIEALQGHDIEALNLYRQGQTLMDRSIERSDTKPHSSSRGPPMLIDNRISAVFARLRVLAALFGEHEPGSNFEDTPKPAPIGTSQLFETTKEARTALFHLTTDIHWFIKRATLQKWPPTATPELIESLQLEQQRLVAELQMWRIQFSESAHTFGWLEPPNSNHSVDSSTQLATTMLRCHRVILYIWMSCALSTSECAYDRYLNMFRTVVQLATEVVDLTLACNDGVPLPFQFELGVIPPLYMTARKCRDPQLRRKALDLLRKAPRQEGLWESMQMVTVSERIIEIEERGLRSDEWPPEEGRIHECMNELHSANDEGVRGHVVTFMRKPWGLTGEWEVWQEWFHGYYVANRHRCECL